MDSEVADHRDLANTIKQPPRRHTMNLQLPKTDPKRLRENSCNSTRKQRCQKRSGRTHNDISAFILTLTLQILGTIAAAHTDRPVFWLLVGPMPLAVGFTLITFIRQGVIHPSLFEKCRQAPQSELKRCGLLSSHTARNSVRFETAPSPSW